MPDYDIERLTLPDHHRYSRVAGLTVYTYLCSGLSCCCSLAYCTPAILWFDMVSGLAQCGASLTLNAVEELHHVLSFRTVPKCLTHTFVCRTRSAKLHV